MGERAVYNLIIGLYAPQGSGIAPVILNCSVPEPSASHLRDGLAGASQEVIPGTMLTYLAQGFQRADEIIHNPPSAPPPDMPAPDPVVPLSRVNEMLDAVFEGKAHIARHLETGTIEIIDGPAPGIQAAKDDLIAVAEGRKVVLINDGEPIVVTPQEAAALDLGQDGDSQFKTLTETDPAVADHPSPSTDEPPDHPPPEPEKHIDPITDAGAGKVIDEAPTEEVQGTGADNSATDGSVSGEK